MKKSSSHKSKASKLPQKVRLWTNKETFPFKNFHIKLIRYWGTTGLYGDYDEELIRDIYTDNNGEYNVTYDHIEGENYRLKPWLNHMRLEPSRSPELNKGKANIVNINAWKPIILKLNLQVSNIVKSLVVSHATIKECEYCLFNKHFHFTEHIYQQGSHVVLLKAKPNAQITVGFHYYTDNTAGSIHQLLDTITTTLADTIYLNYDVDCATF